MGLHVSMDYMNQNVIRFNAFIRAAKKSIPRGRRRNYKSCWTPPLEQLQETVNRARDSMESNPSDQNTEEYSKVKAAFKTKQNKSKQNKPNKQTTTTERRKEGTKEGRNERTHERTNDRPNEQKLFYKQGSSGMKRLIPLSPKKDSSKLWSLTKEQVAYIYKVTHETARLYRRESTLPLTAKKIGHAKEKPKQEEKQENSLSPCLNNNRKISELDTVIRNLKPKKSLRPVDISNSILKHLRLIAIKTVLEMFTNSCSKGPVSSI